MWLIVILLIISCSFLSFIVGLNISEKRWRENSNYDNLFVKSNNCFYKVLSKYEYCLYRLNSKPPRKGN